MPREETKAEEQPKSGTKVFSLPTRQPGQTGKLDPADLPGWLTTGSSPGQSTEEDADEVEETPDSQEQQGKRLTLQELTLLQKTTDELPDWLIDDEHASAPAFEAPKEITTDHFLELLQAADDLPEGTPDPLAASEEAGLSAFDANLPDWLSAVVTPPADADKPPEPPEEQPSSEENLWLTQLRPGQTGTVRPPKQSDKTPADDEEFNWLTELGPAYTSALPQSQEAPIDEPDDDAFDWLTELGPSNTTAPPTGDSTQDFDTASGDEVVDVLSDWLEELGPSGTNDFTAAPYEDEADETLAGGSLPDWLTELEPSPTADAEQPSQQPAAFDEAFFDDVFAEEQALAIDDEVAGDELLNWMSDLEEVSTDAQLPGESPAEPATIEETADDFSDLFEFENMDEPLPDWLTGVSGETVMPRSRAEVDEALAIGMEASDFADEEPSEATLDWLMEIGVGDELADTEPDHLDETFAEVTADAEPAVTDVASDIDALYGGFTFSEKEESPSEGVEDSLFDDVGLGESAEDVGIPEWLTQLGAPVASQPPTVSAEEELIPTSDLPEWLTDMRPDTSRTRSSTSGLTDEESELSQTLRNIPKELAGAELPEWLQDVPSASGEVLSIETPVEEMLEIPDWLRPESDEETAATVSEGGLLLPGELSPATSEWDRLLRDLPPSPDPSQELFKADLPEWVQALKPRQLTDSSVLEPVVREPGDDEPMQQTGALMGMRGIIEIEPVVAIPRETATVLNEFTVTPEQQQQVALLRQLTQSAGPMATPLSAGQRKASLAAQLLLAVALLIAVVLGLLGPDLLRDASSVVPSGIEEAHTAIVAAQGQPVLVAFDYTPAMAGELTPQAEMLLAQLAENDSQIIILSQNAAGLTIGTAVAAAYSPNNLGLVPGEAIGLRQVAHCVQELATCNTLAGRTLDDQLLSSLPDISLIIVLTGERDSLVNWIEQVGTTARVPILAAVTQSLQPVASPYLASGQLQGVIAGLPETAVYQQAFQVGSIEMPIRQQLNAHSLVQLLVVILLLVGGLFYGLSGTLSKRVRQ